MRGSIFGSLIAVAVLAPGCAVVRSTPKPGGVIAAGLTYYLPKRELKITAERKLLKRDSLQKVIATKTLELVASAAVANAVNVQVGTARARLASPTVLSDAEAKLTVNRELAIALGDSSTAEARKKAIEKTIDEAEVGLVAIASVGNTDCVFTYSASLEVSAPVADTRQRFVVNTAHSPLRDDNIKVAVNNAGLLTTANLVAQDRTGDIAVDIAGAVAGLSAPLTVLSTTPPGSSNKVPCGQLPTRYAHRLDPADSTAVHALNAALRERDFPYQLEMPSMSAPRNPGDTDKVNPQSRMLPNDLVVRDRGRNGVLFYRTALPQTVVLRQCNSGTQCQVDSGSTPVEATVIMLPQVGPLSYIPMRSSFLVKTTDDVVFDNGMITSWNANRPSELAEVVRLPVRVLKSIVSIPAELVKLRVDLADQQKGLAASQQSQIEAQARLATIHACVDAAGADREAALRCFKEE